jgi:hypothetical protein
MQGRRSRSSLILDDAVIGPGVISDKDEWFGCAHSGLLTEVKTEIENERGDWR